MLDHNPVAIFLSIHIYEVHNTVELKWLEHLWDHEN